MEAHGGDTMLVPFQCKSCNFQNLKDRDALEGLSRDWYLLAIILRANLDAFWSTQCSTVDRNLVKLT